MQLVLICGPAASGKLTIARSLGEKTGLPILHNHLVVDLVQAAFDFGSPPFVELRESIWLQMLAAAAIQQLPGLILTFTPEKTVHPDFIAKTVATVERAGGKTLFVRLICPEAVLERRIENESRTEFGKLRDLKLYRRLRGEGAFFFPELPYTGLTIDTSLSPPEESALQIIEHFGLATGN